MLRFSRCGARCAAPLSFLLVLTGPLAAQDPPAEPPVVEVRAVTPEPGTEADFFRAVEVVIRVDFDAGLLEVESDPTDPNTLCGIPRIFWPPNGRGGRPLAFGERPEQPARQIRWVVDCQDGTDTCMEPGDRVVIRTKDGVDPACAPAPALPAGCEHLAFRAKAGSMASHAQRFTLMSPQTAGTYAIDPDCRHGICRPGSALSGIPNPVFPEGIRDLMWSYNVELWRGEERLACMDPPGWVEDDSGPPSGGQGG